MDEAELSQVLKEAFRLYGSEMSQAFNVPEALRPLLKNEPALVQLSLKGSTLSLKPFDVDVYEFEIKNLKKKVSEQQTEIKSLSILLEKEKETLEPEAVVNEPETEEDFPSYDSSVPENVDTSLTLPESEPKSSKKKRKRKK